MNVTREIDNFFPGTFDYLNIRVYDDEKTDLLKHWDKTFKYISKAKAKGSKVLVHCKMGVSRSASVVIAYAMKAYNWDFNTAMRHVKDKRNCIKPNSSFLSQLETYQGILDAMKNKEKLQRSKSETNLKSKGLGLKNDRVLPGSEPTPIVQALSSSGLQNTLSGQDLRQVGARPKSWSPDVTVSGEEDGTEQPVFLSLENLNQKSASRESLRQKCLEKTLNRNVLLPCDNGESYSVSPNQIRHLSETFSASVKERISELESQREEICRKKYNGRKKFIFNFDKKLAGMKKECVEDGIDGRGDGEGDVIVAQKKSPPVILRAVLIKKETWDPGENILCANTKSACCDSNVTYDESSTSILQVDSDLSVQKTSSAVNTDVQSASVTEAMELNKPPLKSDPFSNQLDKVFDREERKQNKHSSDAREELPRELPSRQNSWSSYDSAVILAEPHDSEIVSRHSSWGSSDTKNLPSRNSSWGSYDLRLANCERKSFEYIEVPHQSGTVKRSKQRLEENFKRSEINEVNLCDMNDCLKSSSETITSDYPPSVVSQSDSTIEVFNLALLQNSTINKAININENIPIDSSNCLNENSNGTIENSNCVIKNSNCAIDFTNCIVDNINCSNLNSNASNLSNSTSDLHNLNSVTNTSKQKHSFSSAISPQIDIIKNQNSYMNSSKLSLSAPESSSMELIPKDYALSRSASNLSSIGKTSCNTSPGIIRTAQCFSVKQQKSFLESLHNKDANRGKEVNSKRSHEEVEEQQPLGIVQNLKKEFEAKTSVERVNIEGNEEKVKPRVNSLPSSPVSVHSDKGPFESNEDLNFKKLVGKFNRTDGEVVNLRPKTGENKSFLKSRHSCIEVSVEKNPIR